MEDDTTSSPIAPSGFRRLQQRRATIAQVNNMLRAYWQPLLADSGPLAEAGLDRALECYAKELRAREMLAYPS
jgi:hypothetical protein